MAVDEITQPDQAPQPQGRVEPLVYGDLKVVSWSQTVTDTARWIYPRIDAEVRVSIAGGADFEVVFGEGVEMSAVRAHLTLVPYPHDKARLEHQDTYSDMVLPKNPIGHLQCHGGGELILGGTFETSDSIWVELKIRPDHHSDLMHRLTHGLPMPTRLKIGLPDVRLQWLGEDKRGYGSRRLATLGEEKHDVSKVSWKLDAAQKDRQQFPSSHEGISKLIRSPESYVLAGFNWKADGWMLEHDQCRRMAGELLASAMLISTADDQRARVYEAWRIIVAFYDGLLQAERTTREQRTRPGKDLIPSTTFPWRKKDLTEAFTQGRESLRWSGIGRDDIAESVVGYLQSGLTSPTMEWAAADILTHAEIREFGEHVKLTGPGLSWLLYFKFSGNMLRMMFARVGLWLVKALIWFGIPAWWALSKLGEGKQDQAVAIAVGWLALTVAWPFLKRVVTGDPTAGRREYERKLTLYQAMVGCYLELHSDRPARIPLHALQHAQTLGALWPGEVWSILVRADQRDPAFWTAPDRDREQVRLASGIAWALSDEYAERFKAGEILMPDLNGRGYLGEEG